MQRLADSPPVRDTRPTRLGWLGVALTPWAAVLAVGSAAFAHGHGGGGHGRHAQAVKDANSWRDGFRGPHDFGGGVRIPQDAGLNRGLGDGLDGRGFGAAATPLDGGGRLDGSDRPLDGGGSPGYRTGGFAGHVEPPTAGPRPASAPSPAKRPAARKPLQPPGDG